jgi:hypothetical protein
MQRRTIVLTAILALALLFGPSVARAQYQVTNLVSNQENTRQDHGSADCECLGTRLPAGRTFLD